MLSTKELGLKAANESLIEEAVSVWQWARKRPRFKSTHIVFQGEFLNSTAFVSIDSSFTRSNRLPALHATGTNVVAFKSPGAGQVRVDFWSRCPTMNDWKILGTKLMPSKINLKLDRKWKSHSLLIYDLPVLICILQCQFPTYWSLPLGQ